MYHTRVQTPIRLLRTGEALGAILDLCLNRRVGCSPLALWEYVLHQHTASTASQDYLELVQQNASWDFSLEILSHVKRTQGSCSPVKC